MVPPLVYLSALVLLTWPAATSFSSAFYGSDGDMQQNVWNLWWFKKAVCELGVHPWWTDWLFHPDGVTLIAQTMSPFNGLLGIPLSAFLDQIQVYNAIVAFGFVASGCTCFLLARHVTGHYAASLFAGAAFTFCNYHFAHAEGHLQLVSMEWLPLFLLLWIRLLERPGPARALLAAFGLFLVLLCDYYYTFYSVLGGALLFGYAVATGRRQLLLWGKGLGSLSLFALVALLLCGPFAVALVQAEARDPFVGAHDPFEFNMDLAAPFIPGGHWRFAHLTEGFWSQLPGNIHESSVYLGWTVLLPALVGALVLRRQRPWLGAWSLLWVFFFALSLGPRLMVFGRTFTEVPMPYAFLERFIPPLRMSGCPVRMAVMIALATAMLAAYALPLVCKHALRTRSAVAVFLGLFALELWPSRQSTHRDPVPEFVPVLASLPAGAAHVTGVYYTHLLYFQTMFEKPLPWGYVTRTPQSLWNRGQEIENAVANGDWSYLLDRLRLRYLVLDQPPAGDHSRLSALTSCGRHTIYVDRDDPLAPPAPPPELRVLRTGTDPGTQLQIEVNLPTSGGQRYVCLFAFNEGTTTLPGGVVLPLATDDLLQASGDPQSQFLRRHHGVLDASGRATVELQLPAELAQVSRVYACVVLLDEHEPPGFRRIGPAIALSWH